MTHQLYSVRPQPTPVHEEDVGLRTPPPFALGGHQHQSVIPPRVHSSREPQDLRRSIIDHLLYTCGRDPEHADLWSIYKSLSMALRDRLLHDWLLTRREFRAMGAKRIYYLSAEFLLGRTLVHNLINMQLTTAVEEAQRTFQVDLASLIEQAEDPGLGNGGLGRLAACFLDSLATLGYAGYGYGIRYEFGSFEQSIEHGWQRERADNWLRYGNPWEIERHELTAVVQFGGEVEQSVDDQGRMRCRWVNARKVLGVPYDTLIAGYGNGVVNTLRLWSARASRELNLSVFNAGDYRSAVEDKILSESISKVLYPDDSSWEGKRLRLQQQYFFTACSIWDIVRRFKQYHGDDWNLFADKVSIQLNDTHPSIAVPELMRVLLDTERLAWDQAFAIAQKTIAFTNHTLLPEALERWPIGLFEEMLPRHLQIIYEINHRFLQEVHVRFPNDQARLQRMSIIQEQPRQVRMANLAVVGSHSVNGVSALHSELVKHELLRDFYEFWPERFNNKTNGITPRRWLLTANPLLTELVTQTLGRGWETQLARLEELAGHIHNQSFLDRFAKVKRDNKAELSNFVRSQLGVTLPPDALFEVHAKRIHEYKRQLLTLMYVIWLYAHIKANPNQDVPPRAFIFSGKAAPGYHMAKLHIKLIHDVAQVVNRDPDVRDQLKVAFLENYSVSLAELTLPAADLSLQVSLAGTEASGTGNMKMALNGALTLGTYDGANIEIREAVGEEHFFLFGLRTEEVRRLQQEGYDPNAVIARSPNLQQAFELLASGFFNRDDLSRFAPIVHSLRTQDPYLVCADFDAFVEAQEAAAARYAEPTKWFSSAALNVARMGRFSSDTTIRRYAEEIWSAAPLPGGRRSVHISSTS